jgi:hypothetical protein
VGLFQSRDAIRVVGPAELPLVFLELFSNEAERAALGRRAAETLRSQTGATQKTIKALEKLLKPFSAAVSSAMASSTGENASATPPQ